MRLFAAPPYRMSVLASIPRLEKRMTSLRLLVSVSLLTTLQACSTSSIGTDTSIDPRVCESWQTIRPSRKGDKLSPETAQQIAGNNVAREAWCPVSPVFASLAARS
ncbi:hypothetical protein [Caudoviricetes sp.]|nr:hypothetical protein [Caudoviricetes sp.]